MFKIQQIVNDLTQLFTFREMVETLDTAAPPTVQLVSPHTCSPVRHVGILCGSFNPLTLAHTELATRANDAFNLDASFFTLAKVTVNKEQVSGMGLDDRLSLLSLYAAHHPRLGVSLVNRGLYFEQAQAFRSLFGKEVKLSFLIGMDKLLQIFDPRYYHDHDRDTALQQLFSLASLVVANRGDMDEQSFTQFLDQQENRSFRQYVHFFTLPSAIAEVSATAVRDRFAHGKDSNVFLPPEVSAYLSETYAYAAPLRVDNEAVDAYAVRQRLLSALYAVRAWAEQAVDFQKLFTIALSASPQGRALRQTTDQEELVTLIRSCLQEPDA